MGQKLTDSEVAGQISGMRKPTNEELINQMYDASLAGQKTQLEQTRDQGLAELEQQQKLQQQTDANLNRTYVEAAKDQRNYAEIQNAYGLSSGAMAQARLAQDNQLEADLTALRGAQAQVDANIERERTLLSQQYMAAIAQAQAENDLQRAQALYEQARADEERLRQNQKEAGNLMASVGDYTILANLYGLTPEQLNKLMPTQSGGGTGSTPVDKNSQWYQDYLAGLDDDNAQTNDTDLKAPAETPAPTTADGGGGGNTTADIYQQALKSAKGNNDPQIGYLLLYAAASDGLISDRDRDVYMNRLQTEWNR